ncbi:VOC family protein [Ruania suaedae]|uniref:bleomycin resistance protein n=1 Tax=Ruania suaedae TaxID=2897774 RepID=UPI001E53FA77|nr:VOC family protein [Ruania suaedae]UFU04432.1 VOC family protein [Ruania suaedae]
MTPPAERSVPVLPARSVAELMAFYAPLGFTARADPPPNSGYAIIGRGGIELHLHHSPDVDPLRTASSCYLYVTGADALFAEWKAVGVVTDPVTGSRLAPPQDTAYGMREFALVDPSGNLLRIGSPR